MNVLVNSNGKVLISNGKVLISNGKAVDSTILTQLKGIIDGSITDIKIPDGTESIRKYAFYYYENLKTVVIPNSVTSIDKHAFEGCRSLKYNEYDNAYYLGNDSNPFVVLVMAKNRSITSCTINENTKVIYESAFQYRSSLTSIIISNSVTNIGMWAFKNCTSLESIVIPNNVTIIGDYAFEGCTSLTRVIIPNSIKRISEGMLWSCSSLISVNIGNSVTGIGNRAFEGCSSLTNITIPDSVTSIGSQALMCGSSTNKATFTFTRTTPPTIQSNTFSASYISKIIVPAGCGNAYKAATNWSSFASYIEEAAEYLIDTVALFSGNTTYSEYIIAAQNVAVSSEYGEHYISAKLKDGYSTDDLPNGFCIAVGYSTDNLLVGSNITSLIYKNESGEVYYNTENSSSDIYLGVGNTNDGMSGNTSQYIEYLNTYFDIIYR